MFQNIYYFPLTLKGNFVTAPYYFQGNVLILEIENVHKVNIK